MMKNDPETDLIRLFGEVDEPGEGEVFVERVSGRIGLVRFARRVMQVAFAVVGMAMLAFLTPWMMDLTGYVALGSNVLTRGVVVMIFSPVGCAIGGAAGLFVFLRRRL